MEALTNNLAAILVFVGLAILVIEVIILGFSTFVLFFVGLASIIIGVAMFVGLLPETWVFAFVGVAILTAVEAALLWKPLKKMQNKVDHTPVESDLFGYSFVLTSDVSHSVSGQHKYSGINWKVTSENALAAGTEVEVVEVEVGEFIVAAKSD